MNMHARSESGGALWRDVLWREWCFARAVGRAMRWRLAALAGVLILGAALERWVTRTPLDWGEAFYRTWFLILGNPTADFPPDPLGRALTFALPLLGLVVIIDALVDLAFLARDRRQLEPAWCKVMAESMRGHVVVVGLGKLGFRTYKLLRSLGQRVVVIESDGSKPFLEHVRRDGAPLFVGDARRDELLVEANVREAAAIVLATSEDLVNLEVALDARRMNPNVRVVLRMFDQAIADKIAGAVGIHVAMSQSALSAPAFATAALASGVMASTEIAGQLVITRRITVGAGHRLAGKSVGDVMRELGAGVVHRSAGGSATLYPPADARLNAGDVVLLQGPYSVVSGVADG